MFYPGFPGDRAGGKTYGLIFIREYAPQGAGMAARAAELGGGRGEKSPSPQASRHRLHLKGHFSERPFGGRTLEVVHYVRERGRNYCFFASISPWSKVCISGWR